MSLPAGSRVGPYQILAPLGAGGMGEVYRARDMRLDRAAAIKILPELFATDHERLARFEREAKTLASLNHPNIAQIYGLEIAQDFSPAISALAMELVDGENLAARMARGAIPLDDALPIARQIADALEAAHERGIVHRDLKPANIMLTSAGDVKVLDFGLAKATDPSGGSRAAHDLMNSPTITSPATQLGTILGTAAYMAPEQAKGKGVDKRADIWAFGVVLYEMLTGARPFGGETATDVIAGIVTREPNWSALPAATPRAVRELLARCLEKDARRRLRDIGEARLMLERAGAATPDARAVASVAPAWRRALPWAITLAAVALAGFAMWRARPEVDPERLPIHATLDAPAGTVLGEDDFLAWLPTRTPMVFTPDGRALIIQASRDGRPQLYLRSLDSPEARPIGGTDGAHVPFVSPDGKWVGFWAANELRKVSIEGGKPTTICALQAPLGPNGATWTDADVVVFGDHDSGRLMRVSANGGTPAFVTAAPALAGIRQHVTPFMLPGGRVMFSDVSTIDGRDSRLMVQALEGGEATLVVDSATDGRILPSGELAFMRLGTLMTVPFDRDRALTLGEPVVAMNGVMQSALRGRNGAIHTGAGMFAVSNRGALAMVRGAVVGGEDNELQWVTSSGAATSAEPGSGTPAGERLEARLSPDGSRARVSIQTPLRIESWIADWGRNVWTPCERCGVWGGEWSPDGRRIVRGQDDTLVAHTIEGTEPDQVMLQEKGRYLASADWMADGRIVYLSSPDQVRYEIKLLEAGATTGRVLVSLGQGEAPHVSPDGRWLAYATPMQPSGNVMVQAFPGGESRVQVSAGGGRNPLWSPDSRTLYYLSPSSRAGTTLWVADVQPGPTFGIGSPRELFRLPDGQTCNPTRCYDISPAGPRFLMRKTKQENRRPVSRIDLVLDWTRGAISIAPSAPRPSS